MRRLFAIAAATAALAVPATAATAGTPSYDRVCGGVVDYSCRGWVCSLDCFYRECTVWLDPLHDPQLARCL
jgi:hypothetical protein